MSIEVEFTGKVFENKARDPKDFSEIALELRRDIIKSLFLAKSGHSGGPLGAADIMSVLFFGGVMKYDPSKPNDPQRDRFILSAGHMAPVLYSCLARAGYFPIDEQKTLRKFGTRLQGHPALDVNLPGIESASGSLGQGISIAAGMALSQKYLDKNQGSVFCITGDGEIQEGSVWETAMSASHYKLDNLCWIVDNNDCQIDGRVRDVMNIYPIDEKFKSFGFETIVINGNDHAELIKAFEMFKNNRGNGKPMAIIAETKMGKGVSFMNDQFKWHGMPPNEEQALEALKELV